MHRLLVGVVLLQSWPAPSVLKLVGDVYVLLKAELPYQVNEYLCSYYSKYIHEKMLRVADRISLTSSLLRSFAKKWNHFFASLTSPNLFCRSKRTVRSMSGVAIEKRRVKNSSFFYGTPDRIRTYGLRLRKPTLYPAELRVQIAVSHIRKCITPAFRVTRRYLRPLSRRT